MYPMNAYYIANDSFIANNALHCFLRTKFSPQHSKVVRQKINGVSLPNSVTKQ